MEDINKARELLKIAEEACIEVLGPNVSVVTEHIYKALTVAEGKAIATETPTESDEEHAEKAKAAFEALQADVKAGEERQAKAQAAYNAVLAKGGENASIYANKVYVEMLVPKVDDEESIHDFTEDEMLAAVEADQLKEVEPAENDAEPKIDEAENTKAKK